MYKKLIFLMITLITFTNVSANECLVTSDGDYLSRVQFSGFNSSTYVNENSVIFVEIGDLLVDLDGYVQTITPCQFSKATVNENSNDDDIVTIFITIFVTGTLDEMPECLLASIDGEQFNIIKSKKKALLFADNYYVYSHYLQDGIYVFRFKDGFLASNKSITIEDQCVIDPIS